MRNNSLRRKMIRFLKENGLSDKNINEVKEDIIDMEVEATQKGISLEEFLGKDYREFCIELLEVGYDYKRSDILINEQIDTLKISKEILLIMIPSFILSILTFIFDNYEFMLFMAIGVLLTAIITYSIYTRDKIKYAPFTKELIFTNVVALLVWLFFALPTLNTVGDGIFGNYYDGIYESLLEQWVRVIEYTDNPAIINLNKNIIVVNDYLISFSIVTLIAFSSYSYIFKKYVAKNFTIPMGIIAVILALLEYFTSFQVPFMGALVFIAVLYFYIKQFKTLKYGKYNQVLYYLGGFFGVIVLVSLLFDIEFIPSDELYYGQDLFHIIKLGLIGYLAGAFMFIVKERSISNIQNFYTTLNLFIIAYAMFMIASYMYQGIQQFNIENPLESWQSIRILNQMAFSVFAYYMIDTLIRRFGNLDNKD